MFFNKRMPIFLKSNIFDFYDNQFWSSLPQNCLVQIYFSRNFIFSKFVHHKNDYLWICTSVSNFEVSSYLRLYTESTFFHTFRIWNMCYQYMNMEKRFTRQFSKKCSSIKYLFKKFLYDTQTVTVFCYISMKCLC